MAAKRIRASIAKGDIDDAFEMWSRWSGGAGNVEDQDSYQAQVDKAKARVTAWLTQVDADQARLHKAMLACQALDTANNDADVRQATKLAREAIES